MIICEWYQMTALRQLWKCFLRSCTYIVLFGRMLDPVHLYSSQNENFPERSGWRWHPAHMQLRHKRAVWLFSGLSLCELTYSFSLLCFSSASVSRALACCSLASVSLFCRSRRLLIFSKLCRETKSVFNRKNLKQWLSLLINLLFIID